MKKLYKSLFLFLAVVSLPVTTTIAQAQAPFVNAVSRISPELTAGNEIEVSITFNVSVDGLDPADFKFVTRNTIDGTASPITVTGLTVEPVLFRPTSYSIAAVLPTAGYDNAPVRLELVMAKNSGSSGHNIRARSGGAAFTRNADQTLIDYTGTTARQNDQFIYQTASTASAPFTLNSLTAGPVTLIAGNRWSTLQLQFSHPTYNLSTSAFDLTANPPLPLGDNASFAANPDTPEPFDFITTTDNINFTMYFRVTGTTETTIRVSFKDNQTARNINNGPHRIQYSSLSSRTLDVSFRDTAAPILTLSSTRADRVITWTATFNESVENFSLDDFDISGTLERVTDFIPGSLTVTPASRPGAFTNILPNSIFTFQTESIGNAEGSVILSLASGNNITDTAVAKNTIDESNGVRNLTVDIVTLKFVRTLGIDNFLRHTFRGVSSTPTVERRINYDPNRRTNRFNPNGVGSLQNAAPTSVDAIGWSLGVTSIDLINGVHSATQTRIRGDGVPIPDSSPPITLTEAVFDLERIVNSDNGPLHPTFSSPDNTTRIYTYTPSTITNLDPGFPLSVTCRATIGVCPPVLATRATLTTNTHIIRFPLNPPSSEFPNYVFPEAGSLSIKLRLNPGQTTAFADLDRPELDENRIIYFGDQGPAGDVTPPTIQTVTRDNFGTVPERNVENALQLRWILTFDEPITGFDTGDVEIVYGDGTVFDPSPAVAIDGDFFTGDAYSVTSFNLIPDSGYPDPTAIFLRMKRTTGTPITGSETDFHQIVDTATPTPNRLATIDGTRLTGTSTLEDSSYLIHHPPTGPTITTTTITVAQNGTRTDQAKWTVTFPNPALNVDITDFVISTDAPETDAEFISGGFTYAPPVPVPVASTGSDTTGYTTYTLISLYRNSQAGTAILSFNPANNIADADGPLGAISATATYDHPAQTGTVFGHAYDIPADPGITLDTSGDNIVWKIPYTSRAFLTFALSSFFNLNPAEQNNRIPQFDNTLKLLSPGNFVTRQYRISCDTCVNTIPATTIEESGSTSQVAGEQSFHTITIRKNSIPAGTANLELTPNTWIPTSSYTLSNLAAQPASVRQATITGTGPAAPTNDGPPTVDSVTRVTSTTGATAADAATDGSSPIFWRVAFSEDVSGVTADDFRVIDANTPATTIPPTTLTVHDVSDSVYIIEVDLPDTGYETATTIALALDTPPATHTIADIFGANLARGAGQRLRTSGDQTYTYTTPPLPETIPPKVTSVTRVTSNTGATPRTNTATTGADNPDIFWLITFNEPVKGVRGRDFRVRDITGNSIITDASIAPTPFQPNTGQPAAPDPTKYILAINLPDGGYDSGADIALVLHSNDHGITDTIGNRLARGAGDRLTETPTSTNDQTYTLTTIPPDILAPTVTTVERVTGTTASASARSNQATDGTANPDVQWRVTFSEAVEDVNSTDFRVVDTITATVARGDDIALHKISDTIYIVSVDLPDTDYTTATTIFLAMDSSPTVHNIVDTSGNPFARRIGQTLIDSDTETGETYTLTTPAPTGHNTCSDSGVQLHTISAASPVVQPNGSTQIVWTFDFGCASLRSASRGIEGSTLNSFMFHSGTTEPTGSNNQHRSVPSGLNDQTTWGTIKPIDYPDPNDPTTTSPLTVDGRTFNPSFTVTSTTAPGHDGPVTAGFKSLLDIDKGPDDTSSTGDDLHIGLLLGISKRIPVNEQSIVTPHADHGGFTHSQTVTVTSPPILTQVTRTGTSEHVEVNEQITWSLTFTGSPRDIDIEGESSQFEARAIASDGTLVSTIPVSVTPGSGSGVYDVSGTIATLSTDSSVTYRLFTQSAIFPAISNTGGELRSKNLVLFGDTELTSTAVELAPADTNRYTNSVIPTLVISRDTSASDVDDPASSANSNRLVWEFIFTNLATNAITVGGPSDQFQVCYNDGTANTLPLTLTSTSGLTYSAATAVIPAIASSFNYHVCTHTAYTPIESTTRGVLRLGEPSSGTELTSASTQLTVDNTNDYTNTASTFPTYNAVRTNDADVTIDNPTGLGPQLVWAITFTDTTSDSILLTSPSSQFQVCYNDGTARTLPLTLALDSGTTYTATSSSIPGIVGDFRYGVCIHTAANSVLVNSGGGSNRALSRIAGDEITPDDSRRYRNISPTAPIISSITTDGATNRRIKTGNTAISWIVTFNTPVENVNAADFSIAGERPSSVQPIAAQGNVVADRAYRVRYTLPAQSTSDNAIHLFYRADTGNLIRRRDASNINFVPPANNQLTSNDNRYVHNTDTTAPTIMSIQRLSGEPQNIDTVGNIGWDVRFSESVQNFDTTDFTITNSTDGITGRIVRITPVPANSNANPPLLENQLFTIAAELTGPTTPPRSLDVHLRANSSFNIEDASGNSNAFVVPSNRILSTGNTHYVYAPATTPANHIIVSNAFRSNGDGTYNITGDHLSFTLSNDTNDIALTRDSLSLTDSILRTVDHIGTGTQVISSGSGSELSVTIIVEPFDAAVLGTANTVISLTAAGNNEVVIASIVSQGGIRLARGTSGSITFVPLPSATARPPTISNPPPKVLIGAVPPVISSVVRGNSSNSADPTTVRVNDTLEWTITIDNEHGNVDTTNTSSQFEIRPVPANANIGAIATRVRGSSGSYTVTGTITDSISSNSQTYGLFSSSTYDRQGNRIFNSTSGLQLTFNGENLDNDIHLTPSTNQRFTHLDNTPPTIQTFRRASNADQKISSLGSISWDIIFTEPVINILDGADFAITTTNSSINSNISVTGSGRTYVITAALSSSTNPFIQGTDLPIGLSTTSNLNIEDANGNAFATDIVELSTNGRHYVLNTDTTAPTITTIRRANDANQIIRTLGVVSWEVSFSEPILNINEADFFVTNSSVVGTIDSISTLSAQGFYTITATITAPTGEQTTDIPISLFLSASSNIRDPAGLNFGNGAANLTSTAGANYILNTDTSAPTVTISRFENADQNIDSIRAIKWTLAFSEPVTQIGPEDFTVQGASNSNQANIRGNIQLERVASTNTYTLTATLTAPARQPTDLIVHLRTSSAANILDLQGDRFNNTERDLTTNGSHYVLNTLTVPQVASVSRIDGYTESTVLNAFNDFSFRDATATDGTGDPDVQWVINFTEPVSGVDAADFRVINTADSAQIDNVVIETFTVNTARFDTSLSGQLYVVSVDLPMRGHTTATTIALAMNSDSATHAIVSVAESEPFVRNENDRLTVAATIDNDQTYILTTLADTTIPTVTSVERVNFNGSTGVVTDRPDSDTTTDGTATPDIYWRVTFSEDVTGVDAADFRVIDTADASRVTTTNIAIAPYTSPTNTPDIYVIAIDLPSTGHDGTSTLALALDTNSATHGITDGTNPYARDAGDVLIADGNNGETYSYTDNNSPSVDMVERVTTQNTNGSQNPDIQWRIRFSEPVTGVDAQDFRIDSSANGIITPSNPITVRAATVAAPSTPITIDSNTSYSIYLVDVDLPSTGHETSGNISLVMARSVSAHGITDGTNAFTRDTGDILTTTTNASQTFTYQTSATPALTIATTQANGIITATVTSTADISGLANGDLTVSTVRNAAVQGSPIPLSITGTRTNNRVVFTSTRLAPFDGSTDATRYRVRLSTSAKTTYDINFSTSSPIQTYTVTGSEQFVEIDVSPHKPNLRLGLGNAQDASEVSLNIAFTAADFPSTNRNDIFRSTDFLLNSDADPNANESVNIGTAGTGFTGSNFYEFPHGRRIFQSVAERTIFLELANSSTRGDAIFNAPVFTNVSLAGQSNKITVTPPQEQITITTDQPDDDNITITLNYPSIADADAQHRPLASDFTLTRNGASITLTESVAATATQLVLTAAHGNSFGTGTNLPLTLGITGATANIFQITDPTINTVFEDPNLESIPTDQTVTVASRQALSNDRSGAAFAFSASELSRHVANNAGSVYPTLNTPPNPGFTPGGFGPPANRGNPDDRGDSDKPFSLAIGSDAFEDQPDGAGTSSASVTLIGWEILFTDSQASPTKVGSLTLDTTLEATSKPGVFETDQFRFTCRACGTDVPTLRINLSPASGINRTAFVAFETSSLIVSRSPAAIAIQINPVTRLNNRFHSNINQETAVVFASNANIGQPLDPHRVIHFTKNTGRDGPQVSDVETVNTSGTRIQNAQADSDDSLRWKITFTRPVNGIVANDIRIVDEDGNVYPTTSANITPDASTTAASEFIYTATLDIPEDSGTPGANGFTLRSPLTVNIDERNLSLQLASDGSGITDAANLALVGSQQNEALTSGAINDAYHIEDHRRPLLLSAIPKFLGVVNGSRRVEWEYTFSESIPNNGPNDINGAPTPNFRGGDLSVPADSGNISIVGFSGSTTTIIAQPVVVANSQRKKYTVLSSTTGSADGLIVLGISNATSGTSVTHDDDGGRAISAATIASRQFDFVAPEVESNVPEHRTDNSGVIIQNEVQWTITFDAHIRIDTFTKDTDNITLVNITSGSLSTVIDVQPVASTIINSGASNEAASQFTVITRSQNPSDLAAYPDFGSLSLNIKAGDGDIVAESLLTNGVAPPTQGTALISASPLVAFNFGSEATAPRISHYELVSGPTGNNRQIVWRVHFTEPVSKPLGTNFDYQIADDNKGAISSITAPSGDTTPTVTYRDGAGTETEYNQEWDITTTFSGTPSGLVTLSLNDTALDAGTNPIRDINGNEFANVNPVTTGGNTHEFAQDAEPPAISSVVRVDPDTPSTAPNAVSPTTRGGGDKVGWAITFDRPVGAVDKSHFEIRVIGTQGDANARNSNLESTIAGDNNANITINRPTTPSANVGIELTIPSTATIDFEVRIELAVTTAAGDSTTGILGPRGRLASGSLGMLPYVVPATSDLRKISGNNDYTFLSYPRWTGLALEGSPADINDNTVFPQHGNLQFRATFSQPVTFTDTSGTAAATIFGTPANTIYPTTAAIEPVGGSSPSAQWLVNIRSTLPFGRTVGIRPISVSGINTGNTTGAFTTAEPLPTTAFPARAEFVFPADTQAPRLVSITNTISNRTVTWTLTFDEFVAAPDLNRSSGNGSIIDSTDSVAFSTSADATTALRYSIQSGEVNLITDIGGVDNSYTEGATTFSTQWRFSTVVDDSRGGTLTASLRTSIQSSRLTDRAGNELTNATATDTGAHTPTTITFLSTTDPAPRLDSITPPSAPNAATGVSTWTLVFSEPVTGITRADISAVPVSGRLLEFANEAEITIGDPVTSDGGTTWTFGVRVGSHIIGEIETSLINEGRGRLNGGKSVITERTKTDGSNDPLQGLDTATNDSSATLAYPGASERIGAAGTGNEPVLVGVQHPTPTGTNTHLNFSDLYWILQFDRPVDVNSLGRSADLSPNNSDFTVVRFQGASTTPTNLTHGNHYDIIPLEPRTRSARTIDNNPITGNVRFVADRFMVRIRDFSPTGFNNTHTLELRNGSPIAYRGYEGTMQTSSVTGNLVDLSNPSTTTTLSERTLSGNSGNLKRPFSVIEDLSTIRTTTINGTPHVTAELFISAAASLTTAATANSLSLSPANFILESDNSNLRLGEMTLSGFEDVAAGDDRTLFNSIFTFSAPYASTTATPTTFTIRQSRVDHVALIGSSTFTFQWGEIISGQRQGSVSATTTPEVDNTNPTIVSLNHTNTTDTQTTYTLEFSELVGLGDDLTSLLAGHFDITGSLSQGATVTQITRESANPTRWSLLVTHQFPNDAGNLTLTFNPTGAGQVVDFSGNHLDVTTPSDTNRPTRAFTSTHTVVLSPPTIATTTTPSDSDYSTPSGRNGRTLETALNIASLSGATSISGIRWSLSTTPQASLDNANIYDQTSNRGTSLVELDISCSLADASQCGVSTTDLAGSTYAPTNDVFTANNQITYAFSAAALMGTGSVTLSDDAGANTGIITNPASPFIPTGTNDIIHFDLTRPTLTTVNATPDPANRTIDWILTFSEPVSGITSADFAFSTADDAALATATSITTAPSTSDSSASSTTWTFTTTTTGLLGGTIDLGIANNSTITDAAQNALTTRTVPADNG